MTERINKITLPVVWKEKQKKKRKLNLTPEQKEKLSARIMAQRASPEFEARRKEGIRRYAEKLRADPEAKKKRDSYLRGNEMKRIARSRLANAERWADPEKRREQAERIKALWAAGKMDQTKRKYSPQSAAKRIAAATRGHDKKRGFSIPPHKRAEYLFLRNKKISPREAGRRLGLV